MVDYKVSFVIYGPYGTVPDPVDYDLSSGLLSVTPSSQKAAIENSFAQEPDRIDVEILLDDWLKVNIVEGSSIRSGVGSYDIKVFKNGVLDFRGVIALGSINYAFPDETLKLKAYSYSYLLKSEENSSYWDASRTLDLIMSGISSKIANDYDRSPSFLDKDIIYNNTLKTDFPIYEIESFYETAVLDRTTEIGFDSYTIPFHSDAYIIRFRRIDWNITETSGVYHLSMQRFIADISNQVCIDMAIESTSIGDYSSLANAQAAIAGAKADYPEHYTSISWIGRTEYSFLEIYGTTYNVAVNNRTITITGRVFPIKLILKSDERTYLTALKCFMLIHNLTIVQRTSDGYIRIVKNNWGTVDHGDLTSKTISCELLRNFNQVLPDFNCLDALYNSPGVLVSLLTEYYTDFINDVFKYKIIIDDLSANSLSLFDKLSINGENLFITELKKNYVKDEYEIVAWRVND